ncbi:MAG: alpha amylase C-terminal domain-containing protein, partial [Acidimicrobiales bacterium]
MGCEIGQEREWSHDRSLDWDLLGDPDHQGVQLLVRELNRIYRDEPALWQLDFDGTGFEWIDANDADQNVLSFCRYSEGRERALACVANLSGTERPGYRIGLPRQGAWQVALDTTMVNGGYRSTEPTPWHGFDHSLTIDLPSMSVVWLVNG